MLEVILICIAVCADAFAAAYAFGIKGVSIRPAPAVIIGLTGAIFLGVSLAAACAVSEVFPPALCKTLSAAMLILISMKNLADASALPDSDETPLRESMSVRDSVILASALSVDSLGVGFGAGVTMTSAHKLYAVLLCLVLGVMSVILGHFLGGVFSHRASRRKTALISSSILFVTAVMKLV